MRTRDVTVTVSGTSPAAPGTAIVGGNQTSSAERFELVVIDAALVGATGGTLDVYIQRKIAVNTWRDVIHFPQLAAGAAAIKHTVTITGEGVAILPVGGGDDTTPTPALAANTNVNAVLGSGYRVVAVAGASTTVGAAVSVQFSFYSQIQ